MNKEKALERLDALEKEAQALREVINAPEKNSKRWVPKEGECYYFVNDYGDCVPCTHRNSASDRYRILTVKAFKTRELALEAVNKQIAITRVNDKIAELNGDWEPDWKDSEQRKYYLYRTPLDGIGRDFCQIQNRLPVISFMRDAIVSNTIINECLNDLKLIFGIEE